MAATSRSMAPSKRKLANMDMDTFLECGLDGDTSTSESSSLNEERKQKKKKNTKKKGRKETKAKPVETETAAEPLAQMNGTGKKKKTKGKPLQSPQPAEAAESEDEYDEEIPVDKEVMDFVMSSASESEFEDSEEEEERSRKYHQLPKKLEVASSDEEEDAEYAEEMASDDDDDNEDNDFEEERRPSKTKATTKFIEKLRKELQSSPSVPLVREAMQLFRGAIAFVGNTSSSQPRPDKSKKGMKSKKGEEETEEVVGGPSKYQVEGGAVFNKAVQLCLGHLGAALQAVLGQPALDRPLSSKGRAWRRLKLDVKAYLADLLQLLGVMSDAEMALLILGHVGKLLHLYCAFPKMHKQLIKRMIRTWSQGEEATRLMAIVILHRLLRLHKDWLTWVLRQMYVAYVRNCQFTSPDLLPLIAFMRRTLVETLLLEPTEAYELAFVFIRQLVIHLRNAVRVKKKENCQVVYNWQSVRCLELWVELLTAPNTAPLLQPLVYPLTQTLLGTVSLLPTARYIPLRLHLVRAMNKLSAGTNTYIPVLPCILEVFELVDFNKRHKSISAKPFNFACVLKFSKSQMQEKVFREGLIDQLYELLMEQFNIHAHKLSFPELAMPALLQLKTFLKRCKIGAFCKSLKQVVDKVTENSKFINQQRKSVTFSLKEAKAIAGWEERCRAEGTPLTKYYKTWRGLRDRELELEASGKDRVVGIPGVDEIESLKPSNKLKPKASQQDREEFKELFAGDSSESDAEEEDERFLLKSERTKRPKPAKDDSDDSGDYSDLDSDELEQLAQSADEDEASDDEEDSAAENDDDDEAEEEDEESEEEEEEEENEEEASPPPRKKRKQGDKKMQQPRPAAADDDSDDDSSDLDLQDMVEDFRLSESE